MKGALRSEAKTSPNPPAAIAPGRNSLLQRNSEAPPIVHEVVSSPGQPLDGQSRAFMEARLGYDFSQVRVHTDARAAESASALDASAYTVGRDVVFGRGRFRPGSEDSVRLLAHELAHVVQQSAGSTKPANIAIAPGRDDFERQAEKSAAGVLNGASLGRLSKPLLQRAPPDFPGRTARSGGGTLPYHEVTELLDCIRIMGGGSEAYCRQQVLGEPLPQPPTHHQLPGITTPMPIDVELNPDQTASFQVNQINVVFDPDAQTADPAMANRAETTFALSAISIQYRSRGGRITDFTGPGPVEIRIKTTYGPGATPGGLSGYGRGTTPQDVASGDTSLAFHEGRHGLDFVEFMNTHPFPRFIGRVGMRVGQFEASMRAFTAARLQYRQDLNRFSEQRTDCVGRTIDQLNAANGLRTAICRQVPAARRP